MIPKSDVDFIRGNTGYGTAHVYELQAMSQMFAPENFISCP